MISIGLSATLFLGMLMNAPSQANAVLSAVSVSSFEAIRLKYVSIISLYFGLESADESKQTSIPSRVVLDKKELNTPFTKTTLYVSVSSIKKRLTSAIPIFTSDFGNTEKSFFSNAFSDVYFHASSFLLGKPLSSKTLMAEDRRSCSSSSTFTLSSNAINDDSNFSFSAIFFGLKF